MEISKVDTCLHNICVILYHLQNLHVRYISTEGATKLISHQRKAVKKRDCDLL